MTNIIDALKKIDFIDRYKAICINHNDFDNGMRGNNVELYDKVLNRLGYAPKYIKKKDSTI
jgi:hypothetical protein